MTQAQAQDIYTGFRKGDPTRRLPQTIIDGLEAGILKFWRDRKDIYTVGDITTARLKLQIVTGYWMLVETAGSTFANEQERLRFIMEASPVECALDKEERTFNGVYCPID